jgi:cell fate regulator YaaT (PSP1 superfamily)
MSMQRTENVVNLAAYRDNVRQELVDDISARAFLYLRDEAEAHGLSVSQVIAEHMLGLALVVEAVEGTEQARELLDAVSDKLAG